MFSDKAQRGINNYTSIYTAKRGRVQNLQIIGVHIRRGDYLLPGKIKYGYNIVTKKYILLGNIFEVNCSSIG
jgi:hypothetical protein